MKTFALTTRSILFSSAVAVATAGATPESIPQDDAGLADFIGMTFSADERLSAEKLKISVNRGIAVLNGRVATIHQAERAAEGAKSVDGIRAALSLIKIASRGSDKQLTEEIGRRLAASPGLDAKGVTVAVTASQATLTGRVGTWDEQEIARELTSEVEGVTLIDNRLEATGEGSRTDRAIRWQIEREISDDPINEGLTIDVDVAGGSVRLSGEVGSQGEKDLLVRRAQVTGVSRVSSTGLQVVRSLSMEGMTGKTPGPNGTLEALDAAMARDGRLRHSSITSSLDGRLLTLAGTAPSIEVKAAAESTARGVPGVDIVINRIAIHDDRQVALNEGDR